MDLKKYEYLVENKLEDLNFEQLKRLYKDINEKVKQDSFNTFIDYNEKDTVLISKLDAKLNFIQVALSFAHVSRSNPSDIFATVQPWDNMLYARLDRDNIIIPPKTFTEAGESYMGGFVKEPVAGRTDWVVSVDLTSLYPSIIMMLNMSAETLAMKSKEHVDDILNKMLHGEYDTSFAHKKKYCIAANGTMYKKDKIGVIAAAMQELFNTRKSIKDKQLKPIENLYEDAKRNKDSDAILNEYRNKISRLDALQYAYKILANSGYGAIGNEGFRYFRREIAEGITSTGQLAIKYIEKQLNEFLNSECGTTGIEYVIYVDTDSVVGSTKVNTDLDSDITIEKLYDEYSGEVVSSSSNNYTVKPRVPIKTLTYDNTTSKAVYRDVNYIKKHKVKKRMFKLKVNGNEVVVTEDHSLVVERDGAIVEVKPRDVLSDDVFISITR